MIVERPSDEDIERARRNIDKPDGRRLGTDVEIDTITI
jgi:hypothetical protein